METGVSYFSARTLRHVQADLRDIVEHGCTYVVHCFTETDLAYYRDAMREIAAATRSAEISGRLVDEAVIPIGSTAEEFDAHIRRELARWAKVVAKARISED